MQRLEYPFGQEWHVAINKHSTGKVGSKDLPKFMYDAKSAADEVPRMVMMFKRERESSLPETHQQCSHTAPETIKDNHLRCCLGQETRNCPHLLALENLDRCKPEDSDTAKAWTCAAHILMSGGDQAGEGYLMTVGDRMYWDRVYQNMAADPV